MLVSGEVRGTTVMRARSAGTQPRRMHAVLQVCRVPWSSPLSRGDHATGHIFLKVGLQDWIQMLSSLYPKCQARTEVSICMLEVLTRNNEEQAGGPTSPGLAGSGKENWGKTTCWDTVERRVFVAKQLIADYSSFSTL